MSYSTPPQGEGARPDAAARSTSSSVILIVTSIVGGLGLLGVTASTAFGLNVPEPWEQLENAGYTGEYSTLTEDDLVGESGGELYADTEGVTSIEIDAAGSDFTLEFADVTEAVLTVRAGSHDDSGGVNGWTLERSDDELSINREIDESMRVNCLIGCSPNLSGDQSVILTLPRELGDNRTATLDVTVSTGEFTGTGSFDAVDLEVNAGDVTFEGDARTFELDVHLGDATVTLADVEEADLSVATGDSSVTFTGSAPMNVDVEAKMGAMTVQLPKETYRVDVHGMIGEIDNRLDTSKAAKHVIEVDAKAAEIILK